MMEDMLQCELVLEHSNGTVLSGYMILVFGPAKAGLETGDGEVSMGDS